MRTTLFIITIYIQVIISLAGDDILIDRRIVDCIPVKNKSLRILEEYAEIQIVTDLIHKPISEIAKKHIMVENNGEYNRFLTCSWIIYEFQTTSGEIIFNTIEILLGEALMREVGNSGPGANLSKVLAKRIINECKDNKGLTPGHKVALIQNCILTHIKYLENI